MNTMQPQTTLGNVASGKLGPGKPGMKELDDGDWSWLSNLFNGSESLYDNWDLRDLPGVIDFSNWTGEGDTVIDPATGQPDPGPGSPGAPGSADPTGGNTNWMQQLLRALGLGGKPGAGGGGGGGMDIMRLLSMLGMGTNTVLNNNATREATEQMMRANEEATNFLRGEMGAGDERFKPYTDIGREAVWNMNAKGPQALAGRYKPLGSGRGMTSLGAVAQGKV